MLGLAAIARAARTRAGTGVGSRGLATGAELPQPAHFLSTHRAAVATSLLAAGELVGDKLPFTPDRTDIGPMLGRLAAGAIVGATIGALTDRPRLQTALVGALAAAAGTQLGFRGRRRLIAATSPIAAALIEDAALFSIVALGIAALDRDR